MRTVVIRHTELRETKVNDEIGLPPYCSYTIAEYLEDLAAYEGRELEARCGGAYAFSDGTVELLTEGKEAIRLEQVDLMTRSLLLRGAAVELPQLTRLAEPLVC